MLNEQPKARRSYRKSKPVSPGPAPEYLARTIYKPESIPATLIGNYRGEYWLRAVWNSESPCPFPALAKAKLPADRAWCEILLSLGFHAIEFCRCNQRQLTNRQTIIK